MRCSVPVGASRLHLLPVDSICTALSPCSAQFGHVVLTTSQGIMDHAEAHSKHTGGKILGFFY